MFAICKECHSYVEIRTRLLDGPDFCPECRSIDTLDFDYEEDDKNYSHIYELYGAMPLQNSQELFNEGEIYC